MYFTYYRMIQGQQVTLGKYPIPINDSIGESNGDAAKFKCKNEAKKTFFKMKILSVTAMQ